MTSTTEPAHRQSPPEAVNGRRAGWLRLRRLTALSEFVTRRPVLTIVALALAIRVIAAIALAIRGGYTIPDEGQYVELARYVTDGRGADAWAPGYGQSLYDSTYAFSGLLADLFRVFGPHRILGQLIAAVFGATTAGFATWLARRVLSARWALLAGLLVALLPSQVLWSSVVLRESMVWSGAAAMAVGVTLASRARSRGPLVLAALPVTGGLLTLGFLRDQTALIAVWAMLIALCTFRLARPIVARVGALVLGLAITVVSGMGPLGYGLVERAAPSLALERLNLGLGAASSFVKATPVPTPPSKSAAEKPTPTPTVPGGVVTGVDGQQYAIDDSPGSVALHAFPTGIVAMTLRPYPWEPPTSTTMRFAQVEDAGWALLYALAALGAWVGRRRRDVFAYPVAFTIGILLLGAVTQGNLGTAFRHRGQVLWALAPLSALGLHWLLRRLCSRSTTAT